MKEVGDEDKEKFGRETGESEANDKFDCSSCVSTGNGAMVIRLIMSALCQSFALGGHTTLEFRTSPALVYNLLSATNRVITDKVITLVA